MTNSLPTEWNLKDLEDSKDPNFAKQRVTWKKATETFANKWKSNQTYLSDPKSMRRALDEYEQWQTNFGLAAHELYYYWLKQNIDKNNPEIKAKFLKAKQFADTEIEELVRFFELSFKQITPENQRKFLNSSELEPYKHFLESAFEKNKYLLTEGEERILTLKSNPAHTAWIEMVSGFLYKEERMVFNDQCKEEKRNFSEITSLCSNKNKKVRDRAVQAFNEILEKHRDSAEAEINAILSNYDTNSYLRKYTYPAHSRHVSDDVSKKMVDALKEAVQEHYSLTHRYYALKAQLLGLKKLAYHERNVPYGKREQEYNYQKTFELVYKVLSGLDEEFKTIIEKLAREGRIDVYPKANKEGGGFCVHFLKTQPTFILLNHTNKLRDVTTLAHELGHAINNELMRKTQNAFYFDNSMATAEVASTFMEGFVFKELLIKANDETKLELLFERLGDDLSSIVRQIACYSFEEELHATHKEKGYLSQQEIGKIFQKHMGAYMGPAVEQSPGSENWWIYWSHIRRFFYVYSYSSGLLISKALQHKVRENPSFIKEVKQFLSTGTSKSPRDTFLAMDIDIENPSFWKEGLAEIEQSLKEAEKLAKKLGKI